MSLNQTANALVTENKGIFAVDETPGTLTTRFKALAIESTEESRRDYRELLFRTPGLAEHISGAILNDETLRQSAADGTPMVRVLDDQGIIPGVKVDKGLQPLAGAPGEVITEGLDGLRARLTDYREIGVRFTKWRALFTVGPELPSPYCVETNAHALARYAALAQEAGLVPVVETEVLIDGDHSIDRCYRVTEAVLRELFAALAAQRVQLEGLLLKVNMVLSGKDAPNRSGPDEVAVRTLACLKRTVPAAVPGIVFLSGGQSDSDANRNLAAIARLGAATGAPWQLSFSFARALQGAPMKVWAGSSNNAERAQDALKERALVTAMARQGTYEAHAEAALPPAMTGAGR